MSVTSAVASAASAASVSETYGRCIGGMNVISGIGGVGGTGGISVGGMYGAGGMSGMGGIGGMDGIGIGGSGVASVAHGQRWRHRRYWHRVASVASVVWAASAA